MPEENMDTTSQETIVDPNQESQPQVDPEAASQETTRQDDQTGTTGDKELFYQTRYQGLVGLLKSHGIDPSHLENVKPEPGTIEAALQSLGQGTGQQTTPSTEPSGKPSMTIDEEDYDFDDPEDMKRFWKDQMNNLQATIPKVVGEVFQKTIQEVRQQEQMQTSLNAELQSFNEWAKENVIPQVIVNRAISQYFEDFGQSGTPRAFTRTLKSYIRDMGYAEKESKSLTAKLNEKALKSKALGDVEQPAPGAAPSPKPGEKKTPEQELADIIAPDTEYEYMGGG